MVVSTIVGQLAGPLFGLIDKLFTSEDERAAAKQKLLELEQAGELEATRQQLSVILAEAQSADPWTSRARPTFLYLMYVIIMMCVGGAIAGIWWPDSVTTAAQNMTNLLGAIPESLYWLFGAGYLGYTGARSFDKWRGGGP
ncbi:MAG: 3TM-type holin [Alphaproteobacteria bacterium]